MCIYSFSPFLDGQAPSVESPRLAALGHGDLYAWAKVWKKTSSLKDHFVVGMATAQDAYEKTGSFAAIAPSAASEGLAVTYQGTGCCLIERRNGESHHTLTVARGMDLLLMIALVTLRDSVLLLVESSGGGGGG